MNIPFLNREIVSFHAAALVIGGAALVSKLLGLMRDRLLAARFGAGDALDAYYAAFQLPDLLYTILLLGAASAAVLPAYLGARRVDAKTAERFLGNLLTLFGATAIAGALVLFALAPELLRLLVPGFDPEKLAMAVGLTRIMALNVLPLGIAGILASVLQAHQRFIAFALPPIVYNVGIIIGILLFTPALGVAGLAWGVVFGGALQVIVVLPAFFGLGIRYRPRFSLADPALRQVLATSLPRVLALSFGQLTLIALAAIASLFASGSLAAFRLGANLMYVPVGLFGVSYALAVFPKLSDASLARAGEAFTNHFVAGFRTILFWTLPAAALAMVLRAHIVRVVLGSGVFDWTDTRLVAAIIAAIAIAVVSESIAPLVLRAFYALGRTREPLIWNLLSSSLAVVVALLLSAWFVRAPEVLERIAGVFRIRDIPSPTILAVAFGFALGSAVNALMLVLVLRRAVRHEFGIRLRFGTTDLAGMLGAAVLAAVVAWLVLQPFPSLVATDTFSGILLQGVVAGVAGMVVYGLILFGQKNPELFGFWESVRRRLVTPRRAPQVFETEKLDGDLSR
ncbi:murein biosynthesis integral membrane protein MurJ [Candidatus Parcubacteria bacterium]|nr:MAG: murein biosynthesis integral membrane protein MurJ [Candidatus Parcubacteria bacterium]